MTDYELQDYDDSFLNPEHPLYYENNPEEDLYQIGFDEGYQNGRDDASRGMPYDSRIANYPNEEFLTGYEDGYNQGYTQK